MSQIVCCLFLAIVLVVHLSPSFAEPGTIQLLPRILVSTFQPENDPDSGGVFAIRMWNGSRSKGLCNQDQRILIVAVPEHFELQRESIESEFLSRMGAYLDNVCGSAAEGFHLFVSKVDITETAPDRNENGVYARYLDHRWVNVTNSVRDRQKPK